MSRDQDEFGQWRPACNKFGPEYIDAYKSFVNVSEPKEDFEGRLDLYRLYVCLAAYLGASF